MKLLIIDRKIRKFVKNQTASIIFDELKNDDVEIKWLLVKPEIETKGEKNQINYKELEDYNTSRVKEILDIEKPQRDKLKYT